MKSKDCDCGAEITYGKDCALRQHSEWCSVKASLVKRLKYSRLNNLLGRV